MEHHVLRRALRAMLRYAYSLAAPDDPLRALIDAWLRELDDVRRSGGRVQ